MSNYTPADVDCDRLVSLVTIVNSAVHDLHDVRFGLCVIHSIDGDDIARTSEVGWENHRISIGIVLNHACNRGYLRAART